MNAQPWIWFNQLKVGAVFEFYHPGVDGLERGPWIKRSKRTYGKLDDPCFRCRVGTVYVPVIHTEEGSHE